MILCVVGSSTIPFDRLVEAAGKLQFDEELVIQCGVSRASAPRATCIDFMPHDVILDYIRRARLVVTHGGVGSILSVLLTGKRPIVVPRLRRYGDAVDDHQLELARRLAADGLVTLVENPADLPAAVRDADPLLPTRSNDGDSGSLGREIKARIAERVDARTRGHDEELGSPATRGAAWKRTLTILRSSRAWRRP